MIHPIPHPLPRPFRHVAAITPAATRVPVAFAFALAVVCALLAATPAIAHEYYGKSFKVIHPWALPTAPDATSADVYVRFEEITAGDRLIAAHTALAERVELRGAPSPAPAQVAEPVLSAIDLPASGTLDLQPEGMHLTLLNLKQPLQMLRSYPMTLEFERSGPMDVMVSVGAH